MSYFAPFVILLLIFRLLYSILYIQFATFGKGNARAKSNAEPEMENRALLKFAKDCNLLDRKLTRTQMEYLSVAGITV